MVDGPGFRTSIYCAGCEHHCPGCHNPQSWNFGGGREVSDDYLLDIIKADKYANVTFTGGDPMFQAKGFTRLAKRIKEETGKNIWCYTGFLFENLKGSQRDLLKYIDVLVDGPYIERLRDTDLLFRGSSNQRLIDVKASLTQNKVILYAPDVNI